MKSSNIKLKLKFRTEVGYYPVKDRYGYLVYEVGSGKDLLCVVSPALWRQPEQAGVYGMKEADRLHDIFLARFSPSHLSPRARTFFDARAL